MGFWDLSGRLIAYTFFFLQKARVSYFSASPTSVLKKGRNLKSKAGKCDLEMQMLKLLIRKPKIMLLNWKIKTVKCVSYYLVRTKDTCYLSYLINTWALKNKGKIQLSIHPSSRCQHSEWELKLVQQPVHLCPFSFSAVFFWTHCVQDFSLILVFIWIKL